MSVEDITELQILAIDPVSLNSRVGDGEATELGDLVSDDNAAQPEMTALAGEPARILERALERLPRTPSQRCKSLERAEAKRAGQGLGIPASFEARVSARSHSRWDVLTSVTLCSRSCRVLRSKTPRRTMIRVVVSAMM